MPEKPDFSAQTSIVGMKKGSLACYNGLTIECQQIVLETTNADNLNEAIIKLTPKL